MAAAQVLATASTSASSSDVPITSDTVFGLKGAAAGATVYIELKDDGGAYNFIGTLNDGQRAVILAAGTYRFRRPAGISCGVFSA